MHFDDLGSVILSLLKRSGCKSPRGSRKGIYATQNRTGERVLYEVLQSSDSFPATDLLTCERGCCPSGQKRDFASARNEG